MGTKLRAAAILLLLHSAFLVSTQQTQTQTQTPAQTHTQTQAKTQTQTSSQRANQTPSPTPIPNTSAQPAAAKTATNSGTTARPSTIVNAVTSTATAATQSNGPVQGLGLNFLNAVSDRLNSLREQGGRPRLPILQRLTGTDLGENVGQNLANLLGDASTSKQPATVKRAANSSTTMGPSNIAKAVTPTATAAASATAGTATKGNGPIQGWALNIRNALNTRLNNLREQRARLLNGTVSRLNWTPRLPGILQGLRGSEFGGNDVGETLANLFADPRAAGVPEWIETLLGGNSSFQPLQNLANAFNGQNIDKNLQVTLNEVFIDVLKGLNSLDLDINSTASDIVSAILADPGLQASLSSAARQMLGQLAKQLGVTEQLQNQFPLLNGSQCAQDLQALGAGLQQQQLWAMQMLDAMGKLPAGILTGQTQITGDFDECKAISYTDKSHAIEGQMCSINAKAPEGMNNDQLLFGQELTFDIHVCMPKSCYEPIIQQLFAPALEAVGSQVIYTVCLRPKNPKGDNYFLGAIITIGILVLLCAAGTTYGVLLDSKKEKQEQYDLHAKTTGHVNGGLTNKKTAEMSNEGHVNGGFISEKTNGGHVNGYLTNGNVGNGSVSYPNAAFSKNIDVVNMTAVEGTKDEEGMANGQNGSAGENAVDGIAKSIPVSAAVSRSSAEDSLPSKLLLSFSVLRNGRRLLATTKNQADISCLHGIRVLSITWVILGHAFSQLGPTQGNKMGTLTQLGQFTSVVIPAALLAVDTFFLLSGCLTSLLFLRSTKKTGLSLSTMVLYYIHRIWRLTPLYTIMLIFYMGIFPYLLEGPFQLVAGYDSTTNCRDYWYLNILYVNNVVDPLHKMCFGWSWYLSNDMQFYVIAPIVLIPWALRGKAKFVGFVLSTGLILTHVIASGVISYRGGLSIYSNVIDYMQHLYFVPWCRVGPYAVGLLLGYILFATRCRYTMTKMSVALGWAMAWAAGLVLVYVNYDNFDDLSSSHAFAWTAAQAAAYEALAKVLWAVCVSWVIFACSTGYGGFVNTLMSWSAWVPLSRLTYGTYLIHLIVLNAFAGNFKRPFYMDNWSGTQLSLAVTVVSYLLSFVFAMLIEAPTLGLEKAILGKIFRKKH